MTGNQKPRKAKTPPARGGTLVGLFIGLVLGVALAAAVVWIMNRTPIPFVDKTGGRPAADPAANGPLALPGKPGDPVPEDGKSRFEFYRLLPNQKPVEPVEPAETGAPVTRRDTTAKAEEPRKEAQADAKETFWLQAGSYQSATDADGVKARLALMGIAATVQQVMVPNRGSFHRVRIGPFGSVEEASKLRGDLARQRVEASLVRAKAGE